MNLQTLFRSIAGLLIGCGLCLSVAVPAQAGYGNHAERATENIQTRVGIAKITLVSYVGSFKVVEARGGLPQPQPQP
jgi:hypothetical protein